MSRLMSVSFTEAAVRDQSKTVTRRKGWRFVKAGDTLTLCRKVMGRKRGEPLDRICDVEVVHVQRHPLMALLTCDLQEAQDEMTVEGFPGMPPEQFIHTYFVEAQKMRLDDEVTRIEWRYLP